jgi:hypothetical protein
MSPSTTVCRRIGRRQFRRGHGWGQTRQRTKPRTAGAAIPYLDEDETDEEDGDDA